MTGRTQLSSERRNVVNQSIAGLAEKPVYRFFASPD
jgi:hypothetical protein